MPPDPAEAVREAGSVRKLRPEEREAVIRSVARAFYDDPVFSFLLPDDARRGRQLERGFDYFAQRIWLRHNESYTTDSAVGGAFWLPPGEWHLSLLTQLVMMPGLIARLGLRDMPRLLRVLSAHRVQASSRGALLPPGDWSAPEWQGRGLGTGCCVWCWTAATATACPSTWRPPASATGPATSAEASSERNRACYERNGFEVREELRVPGGGPPLWREPAS